jgi:hypothetical protein
VDTETALKDLMTTEGALGACLVAGDSGLSLCSVGGGQHLDLDVAAAFNAEVVRAKMRALKALGMNDAIEDILITLACQYHLIRPLRVPPDRPAPFLYFVLERGAGNLATARHNLKTIAAELAAAPPQAGRQRDLRIAAAAPPELQSRAI